MNRKKIQANDGTFVYIQYTCMCNVGKYNLFVRDLKTVKKTRRWRAFLICSAESNFYFSFLRKIYVYCIYPAMARCSKTTANLH